MATTANAPSEAQLPPELVRSLAIACKAAVLSPPEWMEDVVRRRSETGKEQEKVRSWWEIEGDKWLRDVCELLKISYDSLPLQPTGADIHPLPLTGPSVPLQFASAILSYTLFPPSASHPTSASPSAPAQPAPGTINYPASQRALLSRSLSLLLVSHATLLEAERAASLQLMREMQRAKKQMDDKSEAARKAKEEGWGGKWGRWAATGGGLIIGGVALGVTGGLAAPALLPFIPFLSAAAAPAVLGTLFGLAGGGLTGYRVRSRWAGVEKFEFVQISGGGEDEAPSLTATIFIPGITLFDPSESLATSRSALPAFHPQRDVFHLIHSPQAMLDTGKAVQGFLTAQLIGRIKREIIARTALNAVMAAVALPMTIWGATGMVADNAWVRGCDKARKAGELLAEVLREGVQGARPVVLIGSSLGALTLFTALVSLARASPNSPPFIDTVILISLPISPSTTEWSLARSAVSRRLVNAWSENDLVLASIGRLGEVMGGRVGWASMAGLKKVGREGVEDVDVSGVLGGHFDIGDKMREILEKVGVDQ